MATFEELIEALNNQVGVLENNMETWEKINAGNLFEEILGVDGLKEWIKNNPYSAMTV